MRFDPSADYPLGTKRPDLVTTPSGLRLDQITLDSLRTGGLKAEEIRATPQTLRRQAAVARWAGHERLADNLERAAELSTVPDETILEIYTALRPHRSARGDLERWAERLETEFSAPRTAAFVREAATVYAQRELLGERAAAQRETL